MSDFQKNFIMTTFRIFDALLLLTFPILLIIVINFVYNANIQITVRNWVAGVILFTLQAILRALLHKDKK